ncbi:MAG: hypothetical protein KA771_06300 [Spirochaetales bacterium]|nr:hypothetical protein [Spirochaetales bacterium]
MKMKPIDRFIYRIIYMLIVCCWFPLLSGCDEYALLEQFSVDLPNAPGTTPSNLILDIQKAILERGETTLLYPDGGEKPYTFAVISDDLAYEATPGSVDSSGDPPKYTAGTSIGRVKIRVMDAEKRTADVIVTIRPPKPVNISIEKTSINPVKFTATVSWGYESIPSVTFTILRSDAGSEFVQKATGITGKTFPDPELLDIDSKHCYRIIAEAKTASYTYQSIPADSEPFTYP